MRGNAVCSEMVLTGLANDHFMFMRECNNKHHELTLNCIVVYLLLGIRTK